MTSTVRNCLPILAALLVLTPPGTAPAQSAPADASRPAADQLAEGRRLLTLGSYDEAIGVVQAALDEARDTPEALEEAYLLLIRAYVLAGNYYRFRARGAVTSELYYQKAQELILECLGTEGLRHTTPEPPEEYPPEMLAAFRDVRAAHFGTLRLIGLDPPDAFVQLDDRLLPPEADGSLPELRDLPAGPHRILVRAEGYEDREEPIDIAPGSTLERAYVLERRKGLRWWATRIGGVVAAGTVVAVVAGQGGGDSAPLPGPPDPPQ